MPTAKELFELQALPLDSKVERTKELIVEFYERMHGRVCVAYSGGRDSTVLLHIVRSIYPDVPGVFSNTGLEYPEIVEFVKKQENILTVRPKLTYRQAIDKEGFPVVSKQVSGAIASIRNTGSRYRRNATLGKIGGGMHALPKRYRYLIAAPFKISDKCCNHLKKEPMKTLQKELKLAPYVGMMAEESMRRKNSWMKHTCNIYSEKAPISRPIMTWLQSDIRAYIEKHGIEVAPIYKYVDRTGCTFCAFGCEAKDGMYKFKVLRHLHPKLFNATMEKMGFREVLEYMGHNVNEETKWTEADERSIVEGQLKWTTKKR